MDVFVMTGWAAGVLLIPLVAYRRRLTSALSWIALILLLPWLGPLLYLLLAEHRTTRRVRRRRRREKEHRARVLPSLQEPWLLEPRVHGRRATTLAALSHRLGGFELLGGNDVRVMDGGPSAVDRLVEDIDGAREHVHLLFYIIEADGTGRRVAGALQRAVRRGVRCRVLADAVGSHRFHRRLSPGLRDAGVDVWRGLTLPSLLARLRPLDLRNHRKLAVIDGRTAYTGSMNLQDDDEPPGDDEPPDERAGDDESSDERAGDDESERDAEPARWHDLMVRLEGPAVLQLQLVFQEDWEDATGEALHDDGLYPEPVHSGETPAQVVPSGPTSRVETLRDLLVAAVGLAERRVVVTTPYLIPDEPTSVAFRLARSRGVQVDVIVPAVSDVILATVAGRSYYGDLMDVGVRIHVHREGFLHAKTLTVDDDIAVLGSANFDRRSFFLNFELNLVLYGTEGVARVTRMHDQYLADADPLDPEAWRRRPLPRRVVEDVVRLFSPLL